MAGWMHIAEVALLIAISYAFGCGVGVLAYRAFVRPRATTRSDVATVQQADALAVPATAAEVVPAAVAEPVSATIIAAPLAVEFEMAKAATVEPAIAEPVTNEASAAEPPAAVAGEDVVAAAAIAAPVAADVTPQPDPPPVVAPESVAIRWYAPPPVPQISAVDLLAALADVAPRRGAYSIDAATSEIAMPRSTATPIALPDVDVRVPPPETIAAPPVVPPPVATPALEPPAPIAVQTLPSPRRESAPAAPPPREDLIAALASVVPRASSDTMAESPMRAVAEPAQSSAPAELAVVAAEPLPAIDIVATAAPVPPPRASHPSTAEVLAQLASVTQRSTESLRPPEPPAASIPEADAMVPGLTPPPSTPRPALSLAPRPARTPGLAWSGLIKGRTSTAFVKRTTIVRAPAPPAAFSAAAAVPAPPARSVTEDDLSSMLTQTVATGLAAESGSIPSAAETPSAPVVVVDGGASTIPPSAVRRPPVADISVAPALAEGLAAELRVDPTAAPVSEPSVDSTLAVLPAAAPASPPPEANAAPAVPSMTPTAEIGEDDATRDIESGSARPYGRRPRASTMGDVGAAVAAAQLAVETVLARSGIDPAASSDVGKPRGLPKPRNGQRDNLQAIAGLGPLDETALNNLGIYHFDQIVGWDQRTVLWLENHAFARGRIVKEDWQGLARRLIGDISSVQVTR